MSDYHLDSEHVSKLFCKLDYVGISLLTVGSFVPWIYYGFYCQYTPKVSEYGLHLLAIRLRLGNCFTIRLLRWFT